MSYNSSNNIPITQSIKTIYHNFVTAVKSTTKVIKDVTNANGFASLLSRTQTAKMERINASLNAMNKVDTDQNSVTNTKGFASLLVRWGNGSNTESALESKRANSTNGFDNLLLGSRKRFFEKVQDSAPQNNSTKGFASLLSSSRRAPTTHTVTPIRNTTSSNNAGFANLLISQKSATTKAKTTVPTYTTSNLQAVQTESHQI